MIHGVNDHNGKSIVVEGIWAVRYTNKDVKLAADLGEQVHCFNDIYVKNGVLHISKESNGSGIYTFGEDGLVVKSWDLEEGHCYIERIELNEENFDFVMKVLKVEIRKD